MNLQEQPLECLFRLMRALRRGRDVYKRQLKQYQACQTLLTFVSTDIEVDTRGLIGQALRDGKRVAVPYCVDGTRQMDFYYIQSMKDLAPRTFGVLEPLVERCQKWSDDQNSICPVSYTHLDVYKRQVSEPVARQHATRCSTSP